MADPKQIEQDLNRLEASLNNLAGVINDRILNKLSDTKDRTREWLNEFEKGKDISKKVGDKLGELQRESNKLALNRIKLETDLARAQRLNLTNAEKKIREALRANTLADQEIDKTQTILYNLQQASEEKKKQNNLLNILKDKLKSINKEHLSILGILKFIIDAALRFNKISVEIGKNLGYGADQADRVTQNLTKAAFKSSNINFTLKNAAEAIAELNLATGGVAEYSADALETQIMLTKQFGLTGDEAAGLYKFSILTGQASSQINKQMVGAFASTRNLVRGSANFRTTMAEVAKVSGQLAINFRNNPVEITKAVVQAQALGTTLEQAKNQGKQLLDFESSIENELKAELITGQKINLERARAAALMGDQVTVMNELNSQGITLEKFQNMNVIAQESFAQALGLSADTLSDQLRKQKIAQEQGKSLAQITEEEALEAQKRQNIQDKFNAAIEKLQDLIGNLVAGPVGNLLEAMVSIASNVNILYGVMGALAGLSLARTIGSVVSLAASLSAAGIAGITLSSALTFGIAAAAIGAGIAIVASKMNSATDEAVSKVQSVSDGIAPSGNGPFTITDGFGRTSITAKGDGLAVSPNISRGGNNDDIIAAIDRLASRPAIAVIDGENAFVNRIGKNNTLSTSQIQNTSYRLA